MPQTESFDAFAAPGLNGNFGLDNIAPNGGVITVSVLANQAAIHLVPAQ